MKQVRLTHLEVSRKITYYNEPPYEALFRSIPNESQPIFSVQSAKFKFKSDEAMGDTTTIETLRTKQKVTEMDYTSSVIANKPAHSRTGS